MEKNAPIRHGKENSMCHTELRLKRRGKLILRVSCHVKRVAKSLRTLDTFYSVFNLHSPPPPKRVAC